MEERLQKILSRHGIASRRKAEELIAARRVRVNGAYFHLVWDDMQTQRALDCGFGFRENVGGATCDGVAQGLLKKPAAG